MRNQSVYIHNYRNFYRISIRCWIHKGHPIPRPNGWAMRCILWKFWRKLIAFIMAPHCIWSITGDTLPAYRDLLLDSCLKATRSADALVRASAMSNLGELCKMLRFSFGNVLHEVWSASDLRIMYTTLLWSGDGVFLTHVLQGYFTGTGAIIWTITLNDHVFDQSEWVTD